VKPFEHGLKVLQPAAKAITVSCKADGGLRLVSSLQAASRRSTLKAGHPTADFALTAARYSICSANRPVFLPEICPESGSSREPRIHNCLWIRVKKMAGATGLEPSGQDSCIPPILLLFRQIDHKGKIAENAYHSVVRQFEKATA
jgi:hypothetical protein